MNTKHKSLTGVKITDEAQGQVEAVFATLEVKDSHGDVTIPGAFENGAQVKISAYNHESWKGALPVGKGTIEERGHEAVFKGEFFMDTTAGKDTFAVLKGLGDLQEWSYGFETLEEERGTKDGQPVNIIKKQKVFEVSPVLVGAGVGTRTTAIKSADQKQLQSDLYQQLREAGQEQFGVGNYVYVDDFDMDANWAIYCITPNMGEGEMRLVRIGYARNADGSVELTGEPTEVERETQYVPAKSSEKDYGKKFSEHIEQVVTQVDELTERTSSVGTLRAEAGKKSAVSDEARPQIEQFVSSLKANLETLETLLTTNNTNDIKSAIDAEWLRTLEIELENN